MGTRREGTPKVPGSTNATHTDLCRQLVERVVTEVDVRQTGEPVDGVRHKGDGVVL